MIKLTKDQLQSSLDNLLQQENGLTNALEMTLNSLMYCEREQYLKGDESNKGNGYRRGFAVGMGKQIELRIPRDRLGMFHPMVLATNTRLKTAIRRLVF